LRGINHLRRKILGFILIFCVTLSFYTLIVQAVQQFNDKSLIDQLSLFDSKNLNETQTQFHAGDILTMHAKVKEGDAYIVGLAYSDDEFSA
jgi:hypothetical protein